MDDLIKVEFKEEQRSDVDSFQCDIDNLIQLSRFEYIFKKDEFFKLIKLYKNLEYKIYGINLSIKG